MAEYYECKVNTDLGVVTYTGSDPALCLLPGAYFECEIGDGNFYSGSDPAPCGIELPKDPPLPTMLAMTGATTDILLPVAVALVAVGAGITRLGRRFAR